METIEEYEKRRTIEIEAEGKAPTAVALMGIACPLCNLEMYTTGVTYMSCGCPDRIEIECNCGAKTVVLAPKHILAT